MQYTESHSVDQLILPSQADGVTMVVNRYRDDVGKIVKISLDILPAVVTVVAGPTAGAVSSVAVASGTVATALYDYMTRSKEVQGGRKSSSEGTVNHSIVELGALGLKSLEKLIYEEATQDSGQLPVAGFADSSSKLVKASLKGNKQKVVEMVASRGIKELVSHGVQTVAPQIVVSLYKPGQAITSKIFSSLLLVKKIVQLSGAMQDLSGVREIDRRAAAAISLVQESSKKAKKGERRAIKMIQESAEREKEKIRSKKKKGECVVL